MSARAPFSKSQRFRIFKRDGFTCQYCGRRPPDVVLEVDHITPVALDGDNEDLNLATACFDCNRGKAAESLSKVPQSLEATAEAARERADQMQALADLIEAERERQEDWCWNVAEVIKAGATEGFNSNQFRSIQGFIKRLGYAETLDAAHIAADRWPQGTKRFKYFCGVCWRKIERAEDAGAGGNG